MKGKNIFILILNLCLFLSGCGVSGAIAENESYTLSETVIAVQTDVVMEIKDLPPARQLLFTIRGRKLSVTARNMPSKRRWTGTGIR